MFLLHYGAFRLDQHGCHNLFVAVAAADAAAVGDIRDEGGLGGADAGVVRGGFRVRPFVYVAVSVDERNAGGAPAVRRVRLVGGV